MRYPLQDARSVARCAVMATALLLALSPATAGLAATLAPPRPGDTTGRHFTIDQGCVIRGDSTRRTVALIFTADTYYEGIDGILASLRRKGVKAGFFFTGRMYRDGAAQAAVRRIGRAGHYLGPHSDMHLLYNDWSRRDSLLVKEDSMVSDLRANIRSMEDVGIRNRRMYFVPPYEWWNDSVAQWCRSTGVRMFSFTVGTHTNADYTHPGMGAAYRSSDTLLNRLLALEQRRGLNGCILLVHAGADPRRSDKLYDRLPELIDALRERGYRIRRFDRLVARAF